MIRLASPGRADALTHEPLPFAHGADGFQEVRTRTILATYPCPPARTASSTTWRESCWLRKMILDSGEESTGFPDAARQADIEQNQVGLEFFGPFNTACSPSAVWQITFRIQIMESSEPHARLITSWSSTTRIRITNISHLAARGYDS